MEHFFGGFKKNSNKIFKHTKNGRRKKLGEEKNHAL